MEQGFWEVDRSSGWESDSIALEVTIGSSVKAAVAGELQRAQQLRIQIQDV